MTSRADTCELLATKLLRHFASSKVELAAVLTTSWSPIAGAPPEIVAEVRDSLGGKDENLDDPTSALEVSCRLLPCETTFDRYEHIGRYSHEIQGIFVLVIGSNRRERYIFGPNRILDLVQSVPSG